MRRGAYQRPYVRNIPKARFQHLLYMNQDFSDLLLEKTKALNQLLQAN